MGTSRAWSAGPPAITDSTRRRNEQAWDDLVTDADRHGLRVDPIALAPIRHVRSPILDAPPSDVDPVTETADDRTGRTPSVPISGVMLPAALGLLIAVPLLLIAPWQVALGSGLVVVVIREVRGRAHRLGFTFGGGFLRYRPDPPWPHGVQEDDDVRWRWTGPGTQTEAHRSGTSARR